MTGRILLIICILQFCNITLAQNICSKIERGKALVVNIIPNGDAWTDPYDEQTIKLYKTESAYFIEIWKQELIIKKELTEVKAHEVIIFFEKWKSDRCRGAECGLTYSMVKMKIGISRKSFKSGFYYGNEIIETYINNANTR